MGSFLVTSIWNRVSWSIVCPQTWYVAKHVLEILIGLPSSLESWDCRLMPQTLVYEVLETEPSAGACTVSALPTGLHHRQPHDPIRYIQITSCFSPCYSSVGYKAGWLSHKGLQVLQRSKSESDSLRLYDELWRRGTLFSMTHLREAFCFLWSTSGRNASGGSQGALLASDSLTAKYLTR